jgi:hypothetical protein
MIDDSVNDFLTGGGAPSFKFEKIGDTVRGEIVAAETRQQTDFKTGEPLVWRDGNPRMQLVITLATDLRDPENEADTGERRIFAKGQMLNELRTQLRSQGVRLEVGGKLAVKYSGDGVPTERGLNAPKQFTVQYKAPERSAVAANVDDLL